MEKLNNMDECSTCAVHGFPCIPCSDSKYRGELGPGFFQHKRLLTTDVEKSSLRYMVDWVQNNPLEKVYVDSSFKRKYSLNECDMISTETSVLHDPCTICIS